MWDAGKETPREKFAVLMSMLKKEEKIKKSMI